MKPRERVQAALKHAIPDRVPRFEIWIDALIEEMGQTDIPSAHINFGQDSFMMPTRSLSESNAWKTGVDEWGRVWKNGTYATGIVDTVQDLKQYSTPACYANNFFDEVKIRQLRLAYPDHCMMYGSHLGPFMGAFMAMGFERFFLRLHDEPAFIHRILEDRTEWAIAMLQRAVELGAEVLILGEDAAYKKSPMISTKMWREFVFPYHRRIVERVNCPILFHGDGNVLPVLPQVIEAGFVGYHSLEPAAGIVLSAVKAEYGQDLVLIGNVDVRLLAGDDLDAVRGEVDRCIKQGAPGGGYMIATCNSIYNGLNPEAVLEMFHYEAEVGYY